MEQFTRIYYGLDNYGKKAIRPCPNLKYTTEFLYQNDTIGGILYHITLTGKLVVPEGMTNNPLPPFDDPPDVETLAESTVLGQQMRELNKLFSDNHKTLIMATTDEYGQAFRPILIANNILVRSINISPGTSNFVKEANYTIELESSHMLFSHDITQMDDFNDVFSGGIEKKMFERMMSKYMIDLTKFSIKEWNEDFQIQSGEDQTKPVTSVDRICDYGLETPNGTCDFPENLPAILTTLGGEHITITYSLNAVGKQVEWFEGKKGPLPAWEHAKRFVQTKLLERMGGLFTNFLPMNGFVTRENISAPLGNPGAFDDFKGPLQAFDDGSAIRLPTFAIYNEHFSFDVSESDGSFSVTYNAIMKRLCPDGETETYKLTYPEGPTYSNYCSNNAIHTIQKNINKTMEQNEYTMLDTQNVTITLNGTVQGLIPGGIMAPESKLYIDTTKKGSFLCYNPTTDTPNSFDRIHYAELAFDKIFDYNNYDLKAEFKTLFGVTPYHLRVSPSSRMLPSSMQVVRNMIEGTITWNATYSTKINCDPNNFEINVSTKQPTPIIAEFTVPNNNVRDANGDICYTGRGYPVIQLLGTQSPKTIDVSINASVAHDFNKCCLGSNANYNLIDYEFFGFKTKDGESRLESFIIPSGMVIPYISDKYALTRKVKTSSYPGGQMSFSLSYVCADICEIDDYFKDVKFKPAYPLETSLPLPEFTDPPEDNDSEPWLIQESQGGNN